MASSFPAPAPTVELFIQAGYDLARADEPEPAELAPNYRSWLLAVGQRAANQHLRDEFENYGATHAELAASLRAHIETGRAGREASNWLANYDANVRDSGFVPPADEPPANEPVARHSAELM